MGLSTGEETFQIGYLALSLVDISHNLDLCLRHPSLTAIKVLITPEDTFMNVYSSLKCLLRSRRPLCPCTLDLLAKRSVSELARLPPGQNEKGKAPYVPQDDLPHPPYLPPRPDDGKIKGIPYPRGEVQLKPVFQWDSSLSEKENLRREKLHEKWRKRSPYATAELYAHHEAEPYAASTKYGLMAAGMAFFLVFLAYTNAARLRAEANRKHLMGGTPPERPAKPKVMITEEGLAGDATLSAFPARNTPALDSPAAVQTLKVRATPGKGEDDVVEQWQAMLERGNQRLV